MALSLEVHRDDYNPNIEQPKKFTLTISLVHLVILLCQNEILQYLIEQVDVSDLIKPVLLSPSNCDTVSEKNSWIFKSNTFHLAAKFFPEGLQKLLLSLNKDEHLIKELYKDGKTTPLHGSASKDDSQSTR